VNAWRTKTSLAEAVLRIRHAKLFLRERRKQTYLFITEFPGSGVLFHIESCVHNYFDDVGVLCKLAPTTLFCITFIHMCVGLCGTLVHENCVCIS
jgi:hypothetical protein